MGFFKKSNSESVSASDRDFMAGQAVYERINSGKVKNVTAELDQARAEARDNGRKK